MQVPTQVSARSFAQLKAVFGDCLPKQNGAAMLESSPVAPIHPAELQALRGLVSAFAGKKLAELVPDAQPASTTARPLPNGTSLLIGRVQAARELRTSDGLLRVLTEKKAAAVFDSIAAM
jgi:hypothetical protein